MVARPIDTTRFESAAELADIRAAIQAAWLANEDRTAIEIAQRYDLFGQICMRCAVEETNWTLCVLCARYEVEQLRHLATPIRRDQVHVFQKQWSDAYPNDALNGDGIVGLATMVRGWRPYRTYGIA